jgi:hypothetical protein
MVVNMIHPAIRTEIVATLRKEIAVMKDGLVLEILAILT